jgi:hypothetical protein
MNISEILNSSYDVKIWVNHKLEYVASFSDHQGHEIEVTLQKLRDTDVWMLEFTRDLEVELTGAGDAPKILSTVGKIVQDFLRTRSPAFIVFAASKASKARVSVYRRLIQRLAVSGYVELDMTKLDLIKDRDSADKINQCIHRAGEKYALMIIARDDQLS